MEQRNTMKNIIKALLICGFFVVTTAVLSAQAARETRGGNSALWVGGEFSAFAPDYGHTYLKGVGANVDFDLTPKIGAIGEVRWLRFGNSGDGNETQADYLIGGKYRLLRWNRFDLDGKFLVGGVWITFPNDIGRGSYFAMAPGGFVDYRLTPRFSLRAGYEYQFLPSAPNIFGQPSHGMTPHGFTVGVEYKLLR